MIKHKLSILRTYNKRYVHIDYNQCSGVTLIKTDAEMKICSAIKNIFYYRRHRLHTLRAKITQGMSKT